MAFSADRLLYGNPLDGSVPISINQIQQQEAGVKWRSGGISVFGTVFNAKTKESNYEATTKIHRQPVQLQRCRARSRLDDGRPACCRGCPPLPAPNYRLNGCQHRRQEATPPSRLHLPVGTLDELDALEVGAAIVGTDSFGHDANTITMPGFTTVNLFANYQINAKTQLSLRVNNLFNTLGYTEIEGDGHAARAVNGRSALVQLNSKLLIG